MQTAAFLEVVHAIVGTLHPVNLIFALSENVFDPVTRYTNSASPSVFREDRLCFLSCFLQQPNLNNNNNNNNNTAIPAAAAVMVMMMMMPS